MTANTGVQGMLEPCPFCGGTPESFNGDSLEVASIIYCDGHECLGPKTTAAFWSDAVHQWNTRAAATAPAKGDEPVAWQARDKNGGVWRDCDRPHLNSDFEFRPLYTRPSSDRPASAPDGVREAIRLLNKIADLAYDEDVGEPLDDAIGYANKALRSLAALHPEQDESSLVSRPEGK